VAPSRMVVVSASVYLPCTMKSRRRFVLAPTYPGSPGKGRKTVVCVCGGIILLVYSVSVFLLDGVVRKPTTLLHRVAWSVGL